MTCGHEQRIDGVAIVPGRKFRSSLPSVFIWPMVGSMADRRFSSRRMVGVSPRRLPAIITDADPV